MDEDEEQFYDSLEEDQNCEKLKKKIPLPENENSKKLTKIPHYIQEPKKQNSVSTKIPLYVGEIDKEDIKIFKKNIQNFPCTKKDSTNCLSCEAASKQNKKTESTVKKKVDNSYWSMYCQKNGITLFDKECENFKNLFENNKKFSNLLNSSSCLSGSTWDAPSVFEKYIPKKYGTPKPEVPTYDEEDIDKSTITKFTSTEVDIDNLKSVSQHDLTKPVTSKVCKVIKSKSNTSNVSFRPLSLKCTGPDVEKQAMLRKQQEYGLRASSRNRARIIQNLSKLKQEIK